MGARPKAAEPQEPSNTPRTDPEIEKRRVGTEDCLPQLRGGRARKNKMGEVLHSRLASRTRGSRRATYTKVVRIEKRRVSVAAKTRKSTAGTTREGLLFSRSGWDPIYKETRRNGIAPGRQERETDVRAGGRIWLRSRTVGVREGGSDFRQEVG